MAGLISRRNGVAGGKEDRRDAVQRERGRRSGPLGLGGDPTNCPCVWYLQLPLLMSFAGVLIPTTWPSSAALGLGALVHLQEDGNS